MGGDGNEGVFYGGLNYGNDSRGCIPGTFTPRSIFFPPSLRRLIKGLCRNCRPLPRAQATLRPQLLLQLPLLHMFCRC